MDDVPPPRVLAAFGAEGAPQRLAGGQGESFRAGNAVLKRVFAEDEAAWVAKLFARLTGTGFRVPKPIRSRDGGWTVEGWAAFEYVDARVAGPNGGRWPETLAACQAFHRALAAEPEPAFIRRATHAWAVAERLAWDELAVEPLQPHREAIARLCRLLRPVDLRSQLIHGDFTANVLFAEDSPPCVIDFSPYWRPALFAEAVVIADAVTWGGAGATLAGQWAADQPRAQMLVRAALRRLYEVQEHTRRGRPHSPAALVSTFVPSNWWKAGPPRCTAHDAWLWW